MSRPRDRRLHLPKRCNQNAHTTRTAQAVHKNSEPERQAVELITNGKDKNPVVAMSVEQLNTFPEHMDVTPYTCSWEHFPNANVIIGWTPTLFVGSMKRKFEELLNVNHLVQLGRKSEE